MTGRSARAIPLCTGALPGPRTTRGDLLVVLWRWRDQGVPSNGGWTREVGICGGKLCLS